MKLRIEKEFCDKFTGQKYFVGDEVIFKDDRAAELLADDRGLVTKVEDDKTAPKETAKKTTKKK